jgi:peptidoglycan hydrolase CwlO-like protein
VERLKESCGTQDECKKKIAEYEQKLSGIREEKGTLASQIQYFDTQTYLTQLRISDAQQRVNKLTEEVASLSGKIEGLDTSLNYVSKLLIKKIAEDYKRRDVPILNLVIDPGNAPTLINRMKYAKTTQENDQRLAVQVQQAKLNFEDQKTKREEKAVELEKLNAVLEEQKAALDVQKQQKQQLLAETQNSEAVYQNLLAKAKAELAGFSSFVQSAGGGGLTSFGSGSNGWYYTQRDPSWGNTLLPGSSSSLSLAGCAVTSVAMVCKSYGQGVSPATIAGNASNFIYGDMYNFAFSCSGKSTSWIGSPSKDQVKSYVTSGTPVILRLVAPSVSGLHFIVAWGWDDGASDLKIHDPYYGPDKKFSDQYDWSQVTQGIVIH